jgi:DNA-binding MarR family transcriptional regulator
MQAAVLFQVDFIGDEATPAKISRAILRRAHSVSGLLDRMEKDGLIKRAKDMERKNLVRVRLTEKGKKALKNAAKRESIRNIPTVLSSEEHQQLYSLLLKLREKALRETGSSTPPFPVVPRRSRK